MIIDNIKSLICCIIAVLLLLGVCMTVDYADTDITVSNMNQSKTIELTNTTVLKDTHYILENDSGVARVQPHCHRYGVLYDAHKWQARYEHEWTCKKCGADYDAVTGKEKYSWSHYYLRRYT